MKGFTPTVAVGPNGVHVVYSNAGRMWGVRK